MREKEANGSALRKSRVLFLDKLFEKLLGEHFVKAFVRAFWKSFWKAFGKLLGKPGVVSPVFFGCFQKFT